MYGFIQGVPGTLLSSHRESEVTPPPLISAHASRARYEFDVKYGLYCSDMISLYTSVEHAAACLTLIKIMRQEKKKERKHFLNSISFVQGKI